MLEHSQTLQRQLTQTSQGLLCFFPALFSRNMAQTDASANLLHAGVNYSGISSLHLLLKGVSHHSMRSNRADVLNFKYIPLKIKLNDFRNEHPRNLSK